MKARKDAYRAELEAQIRDKAARVAAEKSAVAAEEARKEKEVAGYNPWGRGGAGAPLRNAAGQVRRVLALYLWQHNMPVRHCIMQGCLSCWCWCIWC